MVSAMICDEIGIWPGSIAMMVPGKNNDGYWNSELMYKQAKLHLDEFEDTFPDFDCVVVYDNSTGHNCQPKEALDIAKLNKFPGGKNIKVMRKGRFIRKNIAVSQSMYFKVGDILYCSIKIETDIVQHLTGPNGDYHTIGLKTKIHHPKNESIDEGSKLIGVLKGSLQIALERGLDIDSCGCKQEAYIRKFTYIQYDTHY